MEMAKSLTIRGFKSIKDQSLECRRVNVLIGEPNVGKSNILEAIGMFSWGYYGRFGYDSKMFCRFERVSNLFYDEDLQHTVNIHMGELGLDLKFSNGRFEGRYVAGQTEQDVITGDHVSLRLTQQNRQGPLADLKAYRFTVRETFSRQETGFLLPPVGDNLFSLLLANAELRTIVNQPFLARGLRLGLRPQESRLEVIKQSEDVIISYPYSLVSETLQRLSFYTAAILTNKESVITFEEPEAHAFPFYTKILAEMIALDQNKNQFFISTHNPYFLLPLLAKAPKQDIAVHVVYFEDYQTKVKRLSDAELVESTELDIFSNLDRFIPGR